MKWLRSKFYYYYMKFKLRQFKRAMKALHRHGTVREIQQAAGYFREVGERYNVAEYTALADKMNENAEALIMRRVLK